MSNAPSRRSRRWQPWPSDMLRWRAFWKALGATLCLCAALWALAPPRYDTNDDVAIRLPLVTALQYTISATLAGGAALAVFVVELMSGRARRSVLAMAAALLAAATLVRPMAAMAGAVSSAVLLLPLALAHPTVPPRRGLVTLATAMTAAGALFVALGYADRWLYRF